MHDIAEFLGGRDPFGELDEEALAALASRTEVEFFPAGATIVEQGRLPQGRVRVVRRGAVELLDHGTPVDQLAEGEMFGHPSVLSGLPAKYEARAAEDTLCYSLSADDVIPLLGRRSSLRFLARSLLSRNRDTGGGIVPPDPEVAQQPAAALIRTPAVTCGPDTDLREAARLMDANEASAVIVGLGDGDFGIVTDRDLRSKVVAGGLTPDDPVSRAMTTPLVTVGAEQSGADVMLAMLDHDIRHIPVFSPTRELLGVVVGIDLVAAETRSPFVLRRSIGRATSKAELTSVAGRLSETIAALHRAELAPAQVSEVTSAIADALIARMIELAIETEGPPAAEFCWMSLGSHGRREPVPSSDVDSGMAWRDVPEADPITTEPRRHLASARTTEYMRSVAADVADAVRVIGWRLDPHGVTATGAFSASSIEDWRRAIDGWLSHPGDNRVLIAISILLDGRVVYGPADELDVKELLFERGDRGTLERWMLRLALTAKPPTGFRRNIVVEGSGEQKGTFDIKRGGLMPIADLARYAALRAGVRATPTPERLQAATAAGVLDQMEARVLEEAYELFSALRLEHQVAQLEQGVAPDNHLDPKTLDPLTRRYLRDAFREVAAVQRSVSTDISPT